MPNPPKGVSFEPEKALGNKNCTNSFHLSCLEIGFVFFSLRNKISLLILFSFPYISHFPSCLHCEEGRTKFRIPRWNKRDRRDGLGHERERKGKAKQTLKSHFFLFHPSPFHFMQMPLWSNNGIQFSFFCLFFRECIRRRESFQGRRKRDKVTFFFLLLAKWRFFFSLRHCRRRRYSTLSRKRLYMLFGEEEEEEGVAESHSGLGYMTE